MPYHAPSHQTDAFFVRIRNETPVLDADMRPSDIAATLKGLRFGGGRAVTIKLADPETRDYLVGCIEGERTR